MSWPPSPRWFFGAPEQRLEIALGNVLRKTGVTAEQIRSRSRAAHVVRARWLAWADMVANGASYSEIGRLTGHDHASVMYGVRRIAQQKESAPPPREGKRGGREAKTRR